MKVKLALGTVQFGLAYGVANTQGQVSLDQCRSILREASAHGVSLLDTAIAYGESEQRLGDAGLTGWRVVSKLPAVPGDCPDVTGWARTAVLGSLERLRVPGLYGLLLHRPDQLLSPAGDQLFEALQQLKADGLVQKVGVSVYAPAELDALTARYRFDLVQAPFNILDRRLLATGWLSRLSADGVEVHVRSVFLQGLLLMPGGRRPAAFARWESLWTAYEAWLQRAQLSPLEACLGFALSAPGVAQVIVGVDSVSQLTELLRAAGHGPVPEPPETMQTDDVDLLNPARWVAP